MNISYNWLKTLINIDLPADQLEAYLTNGGLEVEKIREIKPGNGSLESLVIGEVLEKEKHPNADRLSVTKVSIGNGAPLPIVCGAPNVEKGQKVVIAPVNSMLYPKPGEGFRIKSAKIRGELSEGMICAEDEIGLGTDHDGIIVLDKDAPVGASVAEYLDLKDDVGIEIGLTPNRGDAASHWGVARDLKALLKQELQFPEISYPQNQEVCPIRVEVNAPDLCPRYSGLYIKGVEVKSSPGWLQNHLKNIDVAPINNIVDATNFVLHELGQPIHAFDADHIGGQKIVVRRAEVGEVLITLDETERKLEGDELLICDAHKPVALAGVLGGLDSGINENTRNVFIESAYFDPTVIRKTAKKFGINTDASFRYERGCDPLITVKAMQRVAHLITNIAGGEVSAEQVDVYPKPIEPVEVAFNTDWFNRFCGIALSKERIIDILDLLDIKLLSENGNDLLLEVPPYRSEVLRNVDIAEEVLRIYGYNEVPIPGNIRIPSGNISQNSSYTQREVASNHLSSLGWNEIQKDSQTRRAYYSEDELSDAVVLLNPLGPDHAIMRKELLNPALESVAFNKNRKAGSILFYEFGKAYAKTENGFKEKDQLLLVASGLAQTGNWALPDRKVSFAYLKGVIRSLFIHLGLNPDQKENEQLYEINSVPARQRKTFKLKEEVWYAVIDWNKVLKRLRKTQFKLEDVPQYPEVIRDLSLVLDRDTRFAEVERAARNAVGKFLVRTELFDVYEGEQIDKDKKSYAIRFVLYNPQKTMSDKEIEKLSQKLINGIERETGGAVRN